MTLKRWLPTFLAFPLGGLLAMETVGSLDDPASAAAGGLIAGATVGAAQSVLLARGPLVAVLWTSATAGSWALGWLATWAVVGLNADRGLFVFGSSGALVVTVLTGLALRRVFAATDRAVRPATASA